MREGEFLFQEPVEHLYSLKVDGKSGAANWYDLQGRRVAQPGKGVYIQNGKKIVMP